MIENCWSIDADSIEAVYFMKAVHIKAEGTLPHRVPQARIRQSPIKIFPPQYVLEACLPKGTVVTGQYDPTPFRVSERFDVLFSEEITVNTRSGPTRVLVRVIEDPVPSAVGLDADAGSRTGSIDFPSIRVGALFDTAASAAAVVLPGKRVEATGYSNAFDFTEAFEQAIQNLPPDPKPYPDKMTKVLVEQIGAEFGGFANFHRMFVRVSANM
jgi:hypothetical protein